MATTEHTHGTPATGQPSKANAEDVSQGRKVLWKLAIWLGGGVFFGLLPIWIELGREGSVPSAGAALHNGELFVASAVLCAGAATDRMGRGLAKYDLPGFGAIFSAIIVFFVNTIYYSTLDSLAASSRAPLSIWLFVFAVLSSAACVVTRVEA